MRPSIGGSVADKTFSTFATGTSSQILTLGQPPSGLQWIVWQLTVQTIPFEAGATAIVKRNGLYITSSVSGGRASAQGPPALRFLDTDVYTVQWDGVNSGDELICVILFEETQWNQYGSTFGLV